MENKMFNMKLIILLAAVIFIIGMSAGIAAAVDPNDVLVWQGQYYTGTTFNEGTYEFNFTVYDSLTAGTQCYSNMTVLTTGVFGEWRTEQNGVSAACNNVSKSYFLNININGTDQTPRKRLTAFNFLRKNVDEITISSFEADVIKVKTGFKDLNKAIWQSKLNYAREFANTTLIAQQETALKLINTTTTTGESTEFKIIKLQQAGEQAQTRIQSEFEIATAKILEAKKLALLNGEKPEDVAAIEAEANLHLIALNLTAQEQAAIIEQALNNSIAEVIASDDGIRFCLSNGTNCMSSSGNPFNQVLNTTSDVTFNNITANNGFFSYLGSLVNRITKLFVQDIDATGNIETTQNVSANYFKGDGSLLTNLPAGSGLAPAYLGSDLNATNAARVNVFTVALTPSKMNIVKVYLVQSSSKNGVAIQNRVIISASGPVGNCNFATQTGAGAQAIDNIAVSNNSADTSVTSMALDINVPFINTVTCAVLADANQKDLIIQFTSETVSTVTTHAGSYYTNAVS